MMLETLLDALSLALFMVGAASALVLPGWLQRGKVWGAVLITAILVTLRHLRDTMTFLTGDVTSFGVTWVEPEFAMARLQIDAIAGDPG